MKKALALICLIAATAVMTGCGLGGSFCGGTTVEPILSDKPWANSNNYEYISYDVTRYEAVLADDGVNYTYGDIEATGSRSVTLVTVDGNIYDSGELDKVNAYSEYFAANLGSTANQRLSPGADTYSVLYSEMTLTYADGSDYAGKTDTLTSVLIFRTSSLLPVFSEKQADYQSSGVRYTATADYIDYRNVFTSSEGHNVETSLRNESTAYDNELLYYVIRSHSSLTPGSSSSVSVRNSVYTGLDNAENYRTMAFAVASEENGTYGVSGIDPDRDGFISRYFDDGEVEYSEEDATDEETGLVTPKGYSLPAYYVSLQYSNNNRGATKYLYYSKTGFDYIGETTERVLLQTLDFETDSDGNPSRITSSLISDYKTSTLM